MAKPEILIIITNTRSDFNPLNVHCLNILSDTRSVLPVFSLIVVLRDQ